MTECRRRCRRWSPLFGSPRYLMPCRRSTRRSRTRRRPWSTPRLPAGRPRAGEKPAWITLLGSWRMTWPPVPRARGAPGADGLPLLRGQAADAGQASGLVLRGVIAEASPLRDSAGITPASLGQRRPGRGQDTGSVPQPARPAGPVARAVDSPADKSAPAGDNFPVAVDSGVDSENGHKLCGQGLVSARRLAVERLSPLRRGRPAGNTGTA